MKKYKNIIFLVCINILIFIIILSIKKITPIGDYCFLDIDFFHQYFPMTGELFDRVVGKSSLIYSFTMGLGIPIYRDYFNYLSSPFNILILLFKRTSMISVYSIIICLKGIFSSICMYYLLKKKLGDKFILIPISLMYSFSAYYVAYYWNVMWLDGMTFLPLVILGLEYLVDKNKSLLYILSLSLVIYCNYYIGFMICVFVVLYFVMYTICSKKYSIKQILKKILRFVLSSLCVGLLCSFFIIPLYYSIRSISATEALNIPTSLYYHFSFKDFIFNHFSYVKSTVMKIETTNAPNISCGILSFLLIIPFIFNKKIDLRVKIGYLVLLVFLGVSFFVPALDYFWHICHVPNDLPYRFSFLYSFVLIIISAYSIVNIKHVNKWFVFLSFFITFGLLIFLNVIGYENISLTYIICNYVTVCLYLLFYILYLLLKKKRMLLIMVCITVGINILLTVNINWNMDYSGDAYYRDYNETEEVLNEIKANDNGYYRIGKENLFTFNDSAWYGFMGVNSFSSMEYENIAKSIFSLGYPGNEINSIYYKPGNKFLELLLNIKYVIYSDEDENIKYYETPFNSSFMFKANKEINDWKISGLNPFEIQNDFVNKAYNIKPIYKEIVPSKKEIIKDKEEDKVIKYTYKSDSNYYVYLNEYDLSAIIIDNVVYRTSDIVISDDSIFETGNLVYEDYNEKYIIEVNNESNYFEIYIVSYEDIEPLVYEINEDNFNKFSDVVLKNGVIINKFKESSILGEIEALEDGIIFTSIPYDKGWKVYIDGERVNTYMISDTFLSFSISEGKHNIELKYSIPYIDVGIYLTIIGLIVIIVLIKKEKVFKKKI